MMKIQEKNTLLTPLLEDLYFKHLALYGNRNIEYVKILKNLLTHYCIHDIERVYLFHLDILLIIFILGFPFLGNAIGVH